MPAPSQLTIATRSVDRLLKEEASYHKELAQQEAKVKALQEKIKSGQGDEEEEEEDGNGAFMLKQQQTAVDETKAVFGPLRNRIAEAVAKLEEQIALGEESGDAPAPELEEAKASLAKAKATENGPS